MKIEWQINEPGDWRVDALLLFGFENGESIPFQVPQQLQPAVPWLKQCAALKDFAGKSKQVVTVYGPEDARIPRALLVGLGKPEAFSLEQWRSAVGAAVRKCKDASVKQLGIALHIIPDLPETHAEVLEEALIAALLGSYAYAEHKTRNQDQNAEPHSLILLADSPPSHSQRDAVKSAVAIASGVRLARDLTSGPGNQVTPAYLLQTARRLVDTYGFKLTAIDTQQAEALGMGAFAAVARGSREPAYCIILEHAPKDLDDQAPIVLVGKGITFDTGGISLKPSSKLEAMKTDMAGAAAVLGVFQILGELGIERRVIGIMPCTENMPDGKAYKPGDVIRSLSGLTIEVISTDAEGRMILCDALTYAQRYEPAVIVDIATLTGACIIALGDRVAGVMGNDNSAVEILIKTGERVGEKLWPLPLWDFYFDDIKSDVADFKNVGDRKAGTIIGGVFLKQFVNDKTPWLHIDIAGPSWTDKDLAIIPKGATGFGTRTLLEFIRRWDA